MGSAAEPMLSREVRPELGNAGSKRRLVCRSEPSTGAIVPDLSYSAVPALNGGLLPLSVSEKQSAPNPVNGKAGRNNLPLKERRTYVRATQGQAKGAGKRRRAEHESLVIGPAVRSENSAQTPVEESSQKRAPRNVKGAKQVQLEEEGPGSKGKRQRGAVKLEEQINLTDKLYGCTKCRYAKRGCAACRDTPVYERPSSVRWKPEEGRPQSNIPAAPTFYPTKEEFQDPLAYINKIRPEGEKYGIVCIKPPEGWSPPFGLEKGTNGVNAESFRFLIRKQLTCHLCRRAANLPHKQKVLKRYRGEQADEEADGGAVDANGVPEEDNDFGFVTLERKHTLKSFAAYAEWSKELHFGSAGGALKQAPAGKARKGEQDGAGGGPTVDEIEAEFWRVVETPDQVVESLYGQDLDSGHHGSGFPLPPFRQRLLEEHLIKTLGENGAKLGADGKGLKLQTAHEKQYSRHPWNINNLPRCKGSVLRYVIGDELITGVMVPWLYVGSCMSAFCWHVEDHALYSINYLHMGAAKVWYAVPGYASDLLEKAMKDALPHLFEATPTLMYNLVTMLSPEQLQARGVPVHRLVHTEGSFVITFPNAYHAGFNSGFNCAEAVNFGPPDWLPYGTDVVEKYRGDHKPVTVSHDALLVALVSAAKPVAESKAREEQGKQERAASAAAAAAAAAATDATAQDSGEGTAGASGQGDGELPAAAAPVDGAVKQEEGPAQEGVPGAGLDELNEAGVPNRAPGGQLGDLSFLDPISVEDVPEEAIRLAAGELVLRLAEERRRREAGTILEPPLVPQQRMSCMPGDKGPDGVHRDTEDVDCVHCKCDLYLSAVVSAEKPGVAACPEHASELGCPRESMTFLYRFRLEELEALVEMAKICIPGTAEYITAAIQRKVSPPPKPEPKLMGPLDLPLHPTSPVLPVEAVKPPRRPYGSGTGRVAKGEKGAKRGRRKKQPDALQGPPKPKRKYTRRAKVLGPDGLPLQGAGQGQAVVKPKRKYVRKNSLAKAQGPATAQPAALPPAPIEAAAATAAAEVMQAAPMPAMAAAGGPPAVAVAAVAGEMPAAVGTAQPSSLATGLVQPSAPEAVAAPLPSVPGQPHTPETVAAPFAATIFEQRSAPAVPFPAAAASAVPSIPEFFPQMAGVAAAVLPEVPPLSTSLGLVPAVLPSAAEPASTSAAAAAATLPPSLHQVPMLPHWQPQPAAFPFAANAAHASTSRPAGTADFGGLPGLRPAVVREADFASAAGISGALDRAFAAGEDAGGPASTSNCAHFEAEGARNSEERSSQQSPWEGIQVTLHTAGAEEGVRMSLVCSETDNSEGSSGQVVEGAAPHLMHS